MWNIPNVKKSSLYLQPVYKYSLKQGYVNCERIYMCQSTHFYTYYSIKKSMNCKIFAIVMIILKQKTTIQTML